MFRGGSRDRIDGAISWTTDRVIAERFAHGHRGIPAPDPVIASANVAESSIYWGTNDRQEKEVILAHAPTEVTVDSFRVGA